MDKLNEMKNKEEKNEIIIKYKIDRRKKEINIFGEKFVNNNKNNYILIYDGNEYELSVKLNIKNVGNKTIEVKLKEIKNVTNMESIFKGCLSLLPLTYISKWNTSNVTNMASMFEDCSSLSSLPDISKWNTSNVTNMRSMFEDCSSLLSLPDISKWNTSNVKDMRSMFSGCSSLSSLPDISKWNRYKILYYNRYNFNGCLSLINISDL